MHHSGYSGCAGSRPPLPAEMLLGHRQMYFQTVIKKSFSAENRFGFFNLNTYSASYDNNQQENRLLIIAQANYSIGEGFGVMAGTDMNSVTGFSPVLGPQHNHASKTVLAVTIVSFFLNAGKDFKVFGLYEYKPPIGGNWSFYSRLQFIYNHSLDHGTHNRSYLYLRAGVQYQALIFGLGANLDQFGPAKVYKENYGLFARWNFR